MKLRRFEDLECWQVAREYVRVLYQLAKKNPFCRDLRLVGQITGAGISIMNNIDYITNQEFILGYDMADRCIQVIDGFLRYLRKHLKK